MSEKTGRIHRHNYEKDFTVMSNKLVEDEILSWIAKSLLWYMLSRPADWMVYRAQLAKVYKGSKRGNGKDAVDSAFEELLKMRYIIYTAKDKETKKYIHRYDVYPSPQDPQGVEIQKQIPEPVKPVRVSRGQGLNTPQTRTYSLPRKEKESVGVDPVGSSPSKIFIRGKGDKIAPLDQTDLYKQIIAKNVSWSGEEIAYAWKVLSEYTGVVYDWWQFVSGTVNKYRNKLKSDKASGQSKRETTRCKKTRESKVLSRDKDSCLTSDSSERPCQSSASVMDYVNMLRNGS